MPSISQDSAREFCSWHFTRHKTRHNLAIVIFTRRNSAISILLGIKLGNQHLYQVTCTNFSHLPDMIKLETHCQHENTTHTHTMIITTNQTNKLKKRQQSTMNSSSSSTATTVAVESTATLFMTVVVYREKLNKKQDDTNFKGMVQLLQYSISKHGGWLIVVIGRN